MIEKRLCDLTLKFYMSSHIKPNNIEISEHIKLHDIAKMLYYNRFGKKFIYEKERKIIFLKTNEKIKLIKDIKNIITTYIKEPYLIPQNIGETFNISNKEVLDILLMVVNNILMNLSISNFNKEEK